MVIKFDLLKFGLHLPHPSAVEDTTLAGDNGLEELQEQLKHRKVWMASSLHRGEDKSRF